MAEVLELPVGVLTAEVDGHLVVVEQGSGSGVLLNAEAALILTALDGVASLGEVIDQVVRETGANPPSLQTMATDVVDQLLVQGLLRRTGDSVSARQGAPLTDPQRWRMRVEQILAGHTWSFSRAVQVANLSVRVRSDEPATGKLLSLLLSALPSHPDGDRTAAHSIAVVSLPLGVPVPAEPPVAV